MAEPQTAKRTRTFKPKTKSGCTNCKSGHNKCDETKPICLRCVRLKRPCSFATDHRAPGVSKPVRIAPAKVSMRPVPSLQIKPFTGTALEQRSFHFFTQETAREVYGMFGSAFWLQDILQACHHSPAIRSAAIALGGLHEQFGARDLALSHLYTEPVPWKLTVQHYYKAVHLLTRAGDPNFEVNAHVALITCMLFVCFESLRGKMINTLLHINAAVKIIQGLQSDNVMPRGRLLNTQETPYTSISTLTELFTRLDIQASGWTIGRTVKLFHPAEFDTSTSPPSLLVPEKFASLKEAGFSQEQILSCWLWDYQEAAPDESYRSGKLLARLSAKYADKVMRWNTAFKTLIKSHKNRKNTTFSVNDQIAIHILQLQYVPMLMYSVMDHERASSDETIWDKYITDFEKMIYLANAILNPDLGSAKTPTRPSFSLVPSTLAPLFFIATRCRHPGIRREAISLLESPPRKEGLWDNVSAAIRAKAMMEIEEDYVLSRGDMRLKSQLAGTGGESAIPAEARICGCILELEFSDTEKPKVALMFVRPPPEGKEDGNRDNCVRIEVPCLAPEDYNPVLYDTWKDRYTTQSIYWTRYGDFLQRCP